MAGVEENWDEAEQESWRGEKCDVQQKSKLAMMKDEREIHGGDVFKKEIWERRWLVMRQLR